MRDKTICNDILLRLLLLATGNGELPRKGSPLLAELPTKAARRAQAAKGSSDPPRRLITPHANVLGARVDVSAREAANLLLGTGAVIAPVDSAPRLPTARARSGRPKSRSSWRVIGM